METCPLDNIDKIVFPVGHVICALVKYVPANLHNIVFLDDAMAATMAAVSVLATPVGGGRTYASPNGVSHSVPSHILTLGFVLVSIHKSPLAIVYDNPGFVVPW
jgi:hypothetical protein